MTQIRCAGEHRGIGLHDQQSEKRLRTVRAEIDHVLDEIETLPELYEWAKTAMHSPESRLVAEAKAKASWEILAARRLMRPDRLTLEDFAAATAGADSEEWRDRHHYGSMLDIRPLVPREKPLEKKR